MFKLVSHLQRSMQTPSIMVAVSLHTHKSMSPVQSNKVEHNLVVAARQLLVPRLQFPQITLVITPNKHPFTQANKSTTWAKSITETALKTAVHSLPSHQSRPSNTPAIQIEMVDPLVENITAATKLATRVWSVNVSRFVHAGHQFYRLLSMSLAIMDVVRFCSQIVISGLLFLVNRVPRITIFNCTCLGHD